ncbi:MAG: hypothetical protein NTZ35_08345 [Ignavibacteriales bacterium]|nr:hypothetical protein [Ignavibacteriales bacterium]
MKFTAEHRRTAQAILGGTYTPLDVREFVQFCYLLALPLVRSKIHRGKLNLEILGLNEIDVVYDCLADLFRRDSEGMFTQVRSFFVSQDLDPAKAHEDEILLALRRLVFNRVHCSLVRLYSEADPVLGKILRNMMLELDRSPLLEHRARFGETYLIVHDAAPGFDRAPMPVEVLRERFSQIVSVRDSIPVMLEKLHRVLLAEGEFQRAVPFVTAGLLFKEAYAVGAEAEEAEATTLDQRVEQEDVNRIAGSVCRSLAASTRETYVGSGKRTLEVFELYIETVREIILGEFGEGPSDGVSYYEHLRARMPGLSKAAYSRDHRTVLEYLAKQAKKKMKGELKRR